SGTQVTPGSAQSQIFHSQEMVDPPTTPSSSLSSLSSFCRPSRSFFSGSSFTTFAEERHPKNVGHFGRLKSLVFQPAFTSRVSSDLVWYFSGSPSSVMSSISPESLLNFLPVGLPQRISTRYLPGFSPASGATLYLPSMTVPPPLVPDVASLARNEMAPAGT